MKLPFLNIIKANAEITRISALATESTTELATLKATIEEKDVKIKDYEATIAAFPVADYEKVIEDMKSLHVEELKKVNEELEAIKASTTAKAQAVVASIGISEDVIVAEKVNILTPKAAAEKFESMIAGVDRTAFYNENKSIILKGLGMK